tara:strand:+ start:7737 stop:8921 length:1185 start_codon:yes stop_codon:yes gene_type:complete
MEYKDLAVINHKYTSILHQQPYKVCSKTIMDTSDINITFDKDGVCNHYYLYQDFKKNYYVEDPSLILDKNIAKIKSKRKNREFDCILGISGGVDSSYLAYYATKVLDLKVLLLHIDTGWNSDIAVMNIKNLANSLNLTLHTYVLDWEMIKDLQRSFFLSGVPNLDIPQDHAFTACMYNEAKKNNINYILSGGNMTTESILPNSFGYDSNDSIHLRAIHKIFGEKKLRNYPIFNSFKRFFYYPILTGIKTFRPLDYIEYNKEDAMQLLQKDYGWKSYGQKHHESVYTKFFQNYYLPTKFGFDKRKAHLSSLISSGQITREKAIEEIKKPLYDPKELIADTEFFIKKLDFSKDEFEDVMNREPILHNNYKSYEYMYNMLRKNSKAFYFVKKFLNKI